MGLTYVTINCRGLRKQFKRKVIFAWLLEIGVDIVFLQETHVTNIREAKHFLKGLWGGKHYWSFGTNNSCGVGTLLARDLNYEFLRHSHDLEGRTDIVDIKMGENRFRLINIYAPNGYRERKEYIKNLDIYLTNHFDFILGGDWNFIENTILDKLGGNANSGVSGREEILKLKEDFLLRDAFRYKYPNRKEYSWRQAMGPVHCRLDRFYISESMLNWIQEVRHVYCSVSDHYYTVLKFKDIDNNTGRFGPGYSVNVSTAIGSYIFTTMSGSHFLSRGADVITYLKSNQKGY